MRTKLLVAFLTIALLPLVVVIWVYAGVAHSSLRDSIGTNFEGIAEAKADAIAGTMAERVHDARVLAAQPALVEAVQAANTHWDSLGEASARTIIATEDEAWIAGNKSTPLADSIHSNPLADELRRHRDVSPARYGEIFVTDRLGAAVAMTSRLSDYAQADEEWWSVTAEGGSSGLFIDDRGHDESVDALITGVVVPVLDGDELIGVLKINYKVQGILSIVAPTDRDLSDRVVMVRGGGSIVVDSGSTQAPLPPDQRALLDDTEGANWIESTRGDTPTLVAHAPISTVVHNRIPTPGAVKGVTGERWEPLGWHILVEGTQDVAFTSLRRLRLAGAGLVAVVAIIVALIALRTATSISAPLQRLTRSAGIVGGGQLDHRVGMKREDELGVLSEAFDAMVERLQATLASRDELNHEVIERRKAEAQLRQALDELARSNDDLRRFAYVASHDLQEPLRMITSYLGLVERRYREKLDDDGREFIDFAVDGARRMRALIQSLLEYSRVDRGAGELEEVDAGAVLEQVIEDLALEIEEAGATVSADPLPRLQADPALLRQLIQNLLSNALKFRHPDRPPQVQVSARRVGDAGDPAHTDIPGWRLEVRDNGIGIEQRYHDRIFVIFQRLHQRDQYDGTGIGLAICKRIVERRGGTIALESTPGDGTTFRFTVPDAPPRRMTAD